MPATVDVSCPHCGKSLKVPAELAGKRVKCKGCDEVFAVPAPKPAKPAPKPGAKPAAPAKATKPAPPLPPPAAPAKPRRPFDDDEDDVPGQPAKPIGVLDDDDVPRCPACVKELDPPDAVVCKNCGFNNVTRIKAETRRVIAHDATDWLSHLGPGIAALLIALGLIGWNIYAGLHMREWMEGTFLEQDETDLSGKKKMWAPPGAFITLSAAISLVVLIPAIKFAIQRLIMNPTPPENVKSK